jgi:hypothetical protein
VQTTQADEPHCCVPYAFSRATGLPESVFWQEATQQQSAASCLTSASSEEVARRHGFTVETASRWDWAHVVYWAQQGGAIVYALPQWPQSWTGPDGLMHAYFCSQYNPDPPDYGKFWCVDLCNEGGRWWNAALMRRYWSGWAVGVRP